MADHTASLRAADPVVAALVDRELTRQREGLELIASENFASRAVIDAMGTPLTNKYSEGYPGKRYYGGNQVIDEVERLAIDRAKELFGAEHANVQPHAGAQANFAAFMAVLPPGETLLAMSLSHGGHLSHGHGVNHSGTIWRAVHYGVNVGTGRIDYDAGARPGATGAAQAGRLRRERLCADHRLRRLPARSPTRWAPRCLVDMAHFAGLVAGGVYPSPVPHAPIVTTTTHKTLRGPRGGLILSTAELAQAIDKSVFPGTQGGPLEHVIAAKAVAFGEALRPEFRLYARRVVENAQALAAALSERGFVIVSGGTDSHVLLVDLRPKGVTGKHAEEVLGRLGHHGEPQHDPRRSGVAVRHQRHPARYPGAHHPRDGAGRDGDGGGLIDRSDRGGRRRRLRRLRLEVRGAGDRCFPSTARRSAPAARARDRAPPGERGSSPVAGERSHYDELAYLFVLEGIEYLQTNLPVRRHVSGPEVAQACRRPCRGAVRAHGPQVLASWGIRGTEDFGRIVLPWWTSAYSSPNPAIARRTSAKCTSFEPAFEESYLWGREGHRPVGRERRSWREGV